MTKTVADDIDDFFGTTTPTRGGRSGKLEDLPDGEYTFAVESAEYKPDTSAGPIVSLKLVVVSDGPHDGLKVEKSFFLSKKDDNGNRIKDERQVENLMLDLKTLGFDPENWTVANGRPFRTEFGRAAKAMAQMMVAGKKKANQGNNGKTYHNLYLNKRSDEDGKPAVITKEYLDELEEATRDPFGGQ